MATVYDIKIEVVSHYVNYTPEALNEIIENAFTKLRSEEIKLETSGIEIIRKA